MSFSQIIENGYFVALIQQYLSTNASNVTGAANNENYHAPGKCGAIGLKSKRTARGRSLRDGCFPLFFLKSRDHLLHPAMLAARREHFQTLFLRSPLQDVDVHAANAPAFHIQPGRLVQVDCISPNKRPPIIVDNIFLVRRGYAKPRAKWITRPIRCSTHHFATGKATADCVVASASLTVRIGSSAHAWYVAR